MPEKNDGLSPLAESLSIHRRYLLGMTWPEFLKEWPTPGKILKEELRARGSTAADLRRATGLSSQTIGSILNGSARISGETALRFAVAFRMRADFFANLQADYDVAKAAVRRKSRLIEQCSSMKTRSGK